MAIFTSHEIKVKEEDTQEGKYLTFVLGKEAYALEIRYVSEIIGIQEITPVPDLPKYVRGVINLRGKVIPVMDARLRFSMPERGYDARTCIVVISAQQTVIGLVVDTVNDVLEIPTDEIDMAEHLQGGNSKNRFVKGLGKVENQVKIILNAENLIFEKAMEMAGAAHQENIA